MRIVSGTAPRALRLAGLGFELSPKARRRLKWVDYYHSHGRNARLTCRHFDISPQTFYRWLRRYNPHHLGSLDDRSRRPHRARQPTWSPELAQAVQQLREAYPRWGKDKLAPLLREADWSVSTSMVGRILTRLRESGVLVEPMVSTVSVRRPRPPRPYAVRKPKEYQARRPGDIVQVDSLDLRPLPGVVFKHFTARDVVSRWDVLEVHSRATLGQWRTSIVSSLPGSRSTTPYGPTRPWPTVRHRSSSRSSPLAEHLPHLVHVGVHGVLLVDIHAKNSPRLRDLLSAIGLWPS